MPEPNLGFFPFHTGLLQVELLYFIDQHVQFSIFLFCGGLSLQQHARGQRKYAKL
jgi:hypothetical protein